MTVKELKELLSKYPKDSEVYFHDSDCGGALPLDYIREANEHWIEFDCY